MRYAGRHHHHTGGKRQAKGRQGDAGPLNQTQLARLEELVLATGFLSREKAQELTGCVIGAIPPFSFNERLILLADPLIQENEEVVFNAGRLDRSIMMKLSDYIRIAQPLLVPIAQRG